jgi:hypothetical protein
MKQDRFLIGILAGIALLVVVALVVFFTRQPDKNYLSDDTPEAVVHNYVLAVLNEDYQKAYGYLADKPDKPTLDAFMSDIYQPANVGVNLGETHINGDIATVDLAVVYNPSDPFSGRYSNAERATLVKQTDGWKLTSMPYNFWGYNWYTGQPK